MCVGRGVWVCGALCVGVLVFGVCACARVGLGLGVGSYFCLLFFCIFGFFGFFFVLVYIFKL